MSVKELKALIGRAGLSCVDCVEKSDLRARARQAVARLDEAKRLQEARKKTSPLTGMALETTALIPNHALRKLIEESWRP